MTIYAQIPKPPKDPPPQPVKKPNGEPPEDPLERPDDRPPPPLPPHEIPPEPPRPRRSDHDFRTPIYGWFTEGFDTPELMDAKALLFELG